MALPFDDTTELDDADKGLIGSLVPSVVTADEGRVVWDNDSCAFLGGLTKPQLLGLLGGAVTLDALTTEGDTGATSRLALV